MLIKQRTSEDKFSHLVITSMFKTCDSCGVEHNMVEYFIRIKDGKSEAICPSCGKKHLYV